MWSWLFNLIEPDCRYAFLAVELMNAADEAAPEQMKVLHRYASVPFGSPESSAMMPEVTAAVDAVEIILKDSPALANWIDRNRLVAKK